MAKLWKTTIVIWSEYDPRSVELVNLARAATDGPAYCSFLSSKLVENPGQDEYYDGASFFSEHCGACSTCGGTGEVSIGNLHDTCPDCDGSGLEKS